MLPFASLSGSGSRALFASWPKANASARLDVLEAGRGEEPDDLRSRHDRQGRLPGDDVDVLLMAHARVECVALLTNLSLRQGGACVGRELDDFRIELPSDAERLHEQEVARDQGVLQPELLVRGEAPAAHLPAVVDIVVDQGRGVDELEGRGEIDGLRDVGPTQGPEREEGDHRPDALAAGIDHVPGDVMEEGFLGNDASPDLRLDEGHLVGYSKIQGGRHQGGPNPCYRLALYNHFRRMVRRLPQAATALLRNRCDWVGRLTEPFTARAPLPRRLR